MSEAGRRKREGQAQDSEKGKAQGSEKGRHTRALRRGTRARQGEAQGSVQVRHKTATREGTRSVKGAHKGRHKRATRGGTRERYGETQEGRHKGAKQAQGGDKGSTREWCFTPLLYTGDKGEGGTRPSEACGRRTRESTGVNKT